MTVTNDRVLSRLAPYPVVFVGTVSANLTVPLISFRGASAALRRIAITTSADVPPMGSTDYWKVGLESRPTTSSVVSGGGPALLMSVTGLKGGVWTDLTDRIRAQDEQTVQARFIKVGSPADLTGVAFSFALEVE